MKTFIDVIGKDDLIKYWSSGERLLFNGINYRVGRMSYGDYFLEPREEQGETKPFNRGTLWLLKVKNKDVFVVDELLTN